MSEAEVSSGILKEVGSDRGPEVWREESQPSRNSCRVPGTGPGAVATWEVSAHLADKATGVCRAESRAKVDTSGRTRTLCQGGKMPKLMFFLF